jgi:iron complex outermembrane receptor protein
VAFGAPNGIAAAMHAPREDIGLCKVGGALRGAFGVCAGLAALASAATASAQSRDAKAIQLPPQPLLKSLQQLANQEGVNVLFKSEDVATLQAPAVKGVFSPMEAASKLIAGSALEAVEDGSGTLILRRKSLSLVVAKVEAAQEEAPLVDQLIVTAQKRAERAQDVPISATVVTSARLQDNQINSLPDLARLAPGLTFGAPGESSPGGGAMIRGIGTIAFSRSASPSVGIVVDGIPTGAVNISNLFDIEQVEVLSGPQGTLFGDSVSAGLINIRTVTPRIGEFSGRLSADAAGDGLAGSHIGNSTIRLAANLPLTSTAALRLSAYGLDSSGPVHNLTTGNRSGDSEGGVRGRLLWNPSGSVTVNIAADYNLSRTHDDFFVYAVALPRTVLADALSKCRVIPSDRNFNTCASSATSSAIENYGVSAQADARFAGLDFTYLGGFRQQSTTVNADIDGLPAGIGTLQLSSGPERHPASYLTQEIHVASPSQDRFNYVAGVFYSRFIGLHQQPAQFTLTQSGSPTSSSTLQETKTTKQDVALFGQANYSLAPGWNVIAGGRINLSELRDFHLQNNLTKSIDATVRNISWRIGLQYRPISNSMYYVTATRGYKGPQANDLNTAVGATLIRPELPLYVELGWKRVALQGRLAVDAAVYWASIQDFQGQDCIPPSAVQLALVCVPDNIKSVTLNGIEFSTQWRPSRGFQLSGGALYNVARYPKNYLASDGTLLGGKQLAFAPVFKGTLGGEFSHPISRALEGFISLDAVFTSDIREAPSGDAAVIYPAHWTVGARGGIRRSNWSLALYGRNLLDQAEPVAMARSLLQTPDTSPDGYWKLYRSRSRREVGLSLARTF